MRGLIAVVIALFVVVQAETFSSPANATQALQLEQYFSSQYLQIYLQFQKSSSQSTAASLFLQSQAAARQYSEDDDSDFGEGQDPSRLRLLAAYNFWLSNQIRLYEILVTAPQVQQDYYTNRLIQLTFAQAGSQLPPQLTQALYLMAFNSQLKTLKLAYSLQAVSHIRTWLEDEIDVNSAIVSGSLDAEDLDYDQQDELLNDKRFAMGSYYSFALVDFQTFLVDMYIQQIFMSMQQSGTAASFLEEELFAAEGSSVEDKAQFVPFMMASMMGGNGLTMYTFMLTYYQKMYQLSAAQAGESHVMLENQLQKADEEEADIDVDKVYESSDASFNMWAYNLQQAAQMNYMLAFFNIYSMYAPFQTQGAAAAAQAQAQA